MKIREKNDKKNQNLTQQNQLMCDEEIEEMENLVKKSLENENKEKNKTLPCL